jgi:hypothetical protein
LRGLYVHLQKFYNQNFTTNIWISNFRLTNFGEKHFQLQKMKSVGGFSATILPVYITKLRD